jgi:hypothetical protein
VKELPIDDCRLSILLNRPSSIEIGIRQSYLSLAFLRCDREERAKLLLDFLAFAFGAGDPLLVVFGDGQGQSEFLLALFAGVFVVGHRQNLQNALEQYYSVLNLEFGRQVARRAHRVDLP